MFQQDSNDLHPTHEKCLVKMFLMLAHLFGTICRRQSATMILPPLLKPPSQRTCSMTISKLSFSQPCLSPCLMCLWVWVCCYCYCKAPWALTLCSRWALWKSSLLLFHTKANVHSAWMPCSCCASWFYMKMTAVLLLGVVSGTLWLWPWCCVLTTSIGIIIWWW